MIIGQWEGKTYRSMVMSKRLFVSDTPPSGA
jgi:hypothetical protein